MRSFQDAMNEARAAAPRPSGPTAIVKALSARIIEELGLDNISARSKLGQLIRAGGVLRSGDFRRIEALPRREWESDPTLEEARVALTAMLRAPGGSMELWPTQAAGLIEAAACNGLFAPVGVGRGKALISLLAPVLMGAERPLLLVPAQLRDQTFRKVLPEMRKHWRLHPNLEIRGYSELSLAKNKDMLERIEPDVIVADEVHSLKNIAAARTKRVRAYLKEHPYTRFVALSGTMTRRSLRDYWLILLWALKPDMAPIPQKWPELISWAEALDADIPADRRGEPGALMLFCNPDEEPRDGFRKRLTQTPGVVATSESELGVSLTISRRAVRAPGLILKHLADMRASWEMPHGELITEPVDLWRHAREMACGFYYKWSPAPPADWLAARKAWKKYVRETLRQNRRGLDSELLVAADAERQEEPPPIWIAWRDIRDSFEPNTVPEWLDDYAIEDAAAWLREVQPEGGGICWTEHVAFAERLAAVSGFPYYGAGMDAAAAILDASGPIIASIRAHGEGKNLERWSRNLVVACPPSGKTWEQLLGRTHRQGQQADVVRVEVAQHVDELVEGFSQAMADARYIEDTTGARQKLLYAAVTF